MVTISNVVKNILNNELFYQEAINHGIVSYNKLAETIKPDIEEELGRTVQHNAIVMAIRRYNERLQKQQQKPSPSYFKESLLKSNACYVLVEESPSALNKIQSMYDTITSKKGRIFNIVHGNYEIGIITSHRNKQEILDQLKDEKILRVVEDLVIISLVSSEDFLFKPGIIYNILRFVAWENINIISMILTPQELNVVVSRKDALKTFDILEKLVKISKNEDY